MIQQGLNYVCNTVDCLPISPYNAALNCSVERDKCLHHHTLCTRPPGLPTVWSRVGAAILSIGINKNAERNATKRRAIALQSVATPQHYTKMRVRYFCSPLCSRLFPPSCSLRRATSLSGSLQSCRQGRQNGSEVAKDASNRPCFAVARG